MIYTITISLIKFLDLGESLKEGHVIIYRDHSIKAGERIILGKDISIEGAMEKKRMFDIEIKIKLVD